MSCMLRFFYIEYITSSIKQVQAKNAAYLHSYLIGFAVESALFQEVAISRTVHFQQKILLPIADSLKFH